MKVDITLPHTIGGQGTNDSGSALQSVETRDYPLLIKYMGSKAGITHFITEGIKEVYDGGAVCDLFAGACTLSGAIGHSVQIISNDIQAYSRILAHSYLHRLTSEAAKLTGKSIIGDAAKIVEGTKSKLPNGLEYPSSPSLDEFNKIEKRNRSLIELEFSDPYHLFLKSYSGTWWSAEQCVWIDALRRVSDIYLDEGKISEQDHAILLTCTMHAMAYCGQGTGHYAQYRDATSGSSLKDINLYRQKSIAAYYERKFDALKKWNLENVVDEFDHKLLTLDFEECLKTLEGGTVYADPPYAFVHYSRFYHAIETFVLYDYPELQIKGGVLVKGRYRENRHQSPFSIRSQVPDAFERLFKGIREREANLVLSYSNSGLLDLKELHDLADQCLNSHYSLSVLNIDHTHMTMGRRGDRDRNVEEALLLAVHK